MSHPSACGAAGLAGTTLAGAALARAAGAACLAGLRTLGEFCPHKKAAVKIKAKKGRATTLNKRTRVIFAQCVNFIIGQCS